MEKSGGRAKGQVPPFPHEGQRLLHLCGLDEPKRKGEDPCIKQVVDRETQGRGSWRLALVLVLVLVCCGGQAVA